MDFIEIKVACASAYLEILMAELSEIGFNSFIEEEEGFKAYVEENEFNEAALQQLYEQYNAAAELQYELKKVEKRNWNEEWEKNYDPIIVSDQCIVKASFHTIEKSYPFEILINPKMSFGTGHHATTFQMLSRQLEIDQNDKTILDAGCGTGILGIMASKSGAKEVDACDIDEWCIENSSENLRLNSCSNINLYLGTIHSLPMGKLYDIILANINKNVLLEEIPSYTARQSAKGTLILSGFYEEDIPEIEQRCVRLGYKKIKYTLKDKWACAHYEKEV